MHLCYIQYNCSDNVHVRWRGNHTGLSTVENKTRLQNGDERKQTRHVSKIDVEHPIQQSPQIKQI